MASTKLQKICITLDIDFKRNIWVFNCNLLSICVELNLKFSSVEVRTGGSDVGVDASDDLLNRVAHGTFGGYVSASGSATGDISSPLDDNALLFWC